MILDFYFRAEVGGSDSDPTEFDFLTEPELPEEEQKVRGEVGEDVEL